jgi:hypothetical protein
MTQNFEWKIAEKPGSNAAVQTLVAEAVVTRPNRQYIGCQIHAEYPRTHDWVENTLNLWRVMEEAQSSAEEEAPSQNAWMRAAFHTALGEIVEKSQPGNKDLVYRSYQYEVKQARLLCEQKGFGKVVDDIKNATKFYFEARAFELGY